VLFARIPEPGLPGVIGALFLLLISVGLAIPATTGAAIGSRPERAGAASGLLGTVQFGCGGTIGSLAALAGTRSPITLAVTAAACLGCALILVEVGSD
jgi:DHA1 family bicyclomycin/chloramphenicol resistance-like MFS transporter